mgnify:FL=1
MHTAKGLWMSDGKSGAMQLLEKQIAYKEAKIRAGEKTIEDQKRQLSNIKERMNKLIKKEAKL